MKTAPVLTAYDYYALPADDEDVRGGNGVGGGDEGDGSGCSDCDGEWVYRVASALLTQPFENAVTDFLRFAGESAEADRTWIIRYNEDATQFYNTHEWCRPGVKSYVEDLQHTPVSMIAWLHDRLVRREAVMINAADKLPRTARALQAEFARQKDRSVLCVPVFQEGQIFAIIGFDTVRAPRNWTPKIARTLFRCGTLIAAAWARASAADSNSDADTNAVAVNASVGTAGTMANQRPALIYLHQGGAVRGVPMSQILAVSAEGDYTRVHLAQNVSALELRPLKAWVSLLPRGDFQQVHRGALVNVHQVGSLERPTSGSWRVHVRGLAEPLNVSKAFRAEVRSRLGF